MIAILRKHFLTMRVRGAASRDVHKFTSGQPSDGYQLGGGREKFRGGRNLNFGRTSEVVEYPCKEYAQHMQSSVQTRET